MRTEVASAVDVAARIARFGLTPELEPLDIRDHDWRRTAPALTTHRLTGLAMAAAESGALLLTQEQREDLLERHRVAMLAALAIERQLVIVAGALAEARIESIVLKGAAVAHTIYPDPSWRPFGDADLLVRPYDFDRTSKLLASMGYRRRLPEPRPGFSRRFAQGSAHRSRDGIEFDLHRTLTLGPFGIWLNVEDLFNLRREFLLGGVPLHRLGGPDLFVHACIHSALGSSTPQIWTLRDVVETARFEEMDWDLAWDRAGRWRARPVLAQAMNEAGRRLGIRFSKEAEESLSYDPSRKERRALNAYSTNVARGGRERATIGAIPGLRAKLAYIFALLFPSKEFLRARSRDGSYLSRWRTPLRWIRPRRKVGP